MTYPDSSPDLGAVLLSFYECLTDPGQLEALMEMLTSWLDHEEGEITAPKLDYHADKAWRLLDEISESDYEDAIEAGTYDVRQFNTPEDVKAVFKDSIRPEDLEKLNTWLSGDAEDTALLLRLAEGESTELVILSRAPKDGTFIAKRTGTEFQSIISKFVADSFELTHAEFQLVQELLLGGTLREISDRLGKSWETTRSQVKSLTNKLGVSSQSDILRLVGQASNLMPSAPTSGRRAGDLATKKLVRPDGRTVIYEVDGPPSDKTLIYLHGLIQGRHWPEKAQAYAQSRGWRIVRISRPGRGQSSINPKEDAALLQDHVHDVLDIMGQENIETASFYAASEGFPIAYLLALQNPERVQGVVGIEVTPPILSREVINGFMGKMKTFGLACRYAPKTVKYMLGLALRQLERMEDRYNAIHPLIGIRMADVEDAEGIRADERNFQDLMVHKAEGIWRDTSYLCHDWAYAQENTNTRPRAALIHCANSMIKSQGNMDIFAQRIGAPIYRIDSYLPYITSSLPTALDVLEQT